MAMGKKQTMNMATIQRMVKTDFLYLAMRIAGRAAFCANYSKNFKVSH